MSGPKTPPTRLRRAITNQISSKRASVWEHHHPASSINHSPTPDQTDRQTKLLPEVRGVADGPHERVAHQQLDRPVTSEEPHALRRHPTHVRNVANFVPLRTEQKAVRHVVLPVEDGKRGDLQPSHLTHAMVQNKTKQKQKRR